jgi:hypothetical protein
VEQSRVIGLECSALTGIGPEETRIGAGRGKKASDGNFQLFLQPNTVESAST